MNKQEAKQALLQGKKVRHEKWLSDRWIRYENGLMYFENGVESVWNVDKYMDLSDPDGWQIFEEPNKVEPIDTEEFRQLLAPYLLLSDTEIVNAFKDVKQFIRDNYIPKQ